jgi:DNA-binding winged helix-turn-helix (wHTH) protein
MSIDYGPAACPEAAERRAIKTESVRPYGIRTRGIPNYPVAARRSDGTLLTLSDLPDPNSRWTRLRRQTVMECIDLGLLSPEVARRRYRLNDAELGEWRAVAAGGGRAALAWPHRPRVVTRGTISRGALEIDLDAKDVHIEGEIVPLSASEWTVLATIAEANGEIVTAAMIMGALYGEPSKAAGVKIVDVLVCRLRRKLGVAADLLEVVWGRGYFLADRHSVYA